MQIGRWAWYLYLFLWFWSVPLLVFDLVPPNTEWMGTLILVLSGGLAGWWLYQRFRSAGLLAAVLIVLLSWLAEHIGVTTGWPFGSYSYTAVLQPKLLGTVPLAIPMAWLLVVPGALEVARLMLGPQRPWLQVLLAATLALLLDVTIEPVATTIQGYWIWHEPGPLVDVPTANFIAWWSLALLLAASTRLVLDASRWRGRFSGGMTIPAWIYLLTLGLFTLVNLSHGQLVAGAVGSVTLAGCAGRLQRRTSAWPLRFEALC